MEQNIKVIFNEKKSCYVMIDYYKDRNPVGKIYNSALGCCHDFFSLTSLIKLIDEVILSESEKDDLAQRHFFENIETESEWDQQTTEKIIFTINGYNCNKIQVFRPNPPMFIEDKDMSLWWSYYSENDGSGDSFPIRDILVNGISHCLQPLEN